LNLLDFEKLCEECKNEFNSRKKFILICGGTGCTSSHSQDIINEFEKEFKEKNISDVEIIKTGCFGFCALGPIVIIYPEGSFYSSFKLKNVSKVVNEHIINSRVVKDLLYKETISKEKLLKFEELDFFKKQKRIVLRNCGIIAPENIRDYIACDGYKALKKALYEMSPADVIEVVKESGLRGRGGGGFPTGLKWSFTQKSSGDKKFIACNADEGDPGAFMDRSVLEGDPHSVIVAMAIAGYAIGADMGYVYVRAEYPIAVERLEIAINQSREYGFLGKNILDKNFDFDIEIRLGAGAFVCGEETALIRSIEGNRGEPRPRPPFPAIQGIFGLPTNLNNVETYANIAPIILKGANWFKSIGTEKSPGTKVFALGGKINNIGLVEVPMGTTMREIIYDVGDGIPNGKKFKAAQTGGPSGGCVPVHLLDTPVDFDSLGAIGSMMGSGGLIVMDEDNCMVNIAKFFLEFTVDESCGKCPPCRIGTKRMLEILERITNGEGEANDIDKLEKLALGIKSTALCGLGQTAPNPVLSTIRYFRDEYMAHISQKICPAKQCKKLILIQISQTKCRGCGLCKKVCPTNAISGEIKNTHVIDQKKCIKCKACVSKCPFGAIN
jgi:NADH:ubiquinone oxidoreductase subunit F (NADH-binding)/(2Fe-2S) ferredoxin